MKIAFILELPSTPATLNPELKINSAINMSVIFFTYALLSSIKPKIHDARYKIIYVKNKLENLCW